MGRFYHLSKSVTEEESEKIIRELRELGDVENVEVTEDHEYLRVETKDGTYSGVMSAAVNICSRVADGCGLSFAKFAYDEKTR